MYAFVAYGGMPTYGGMANMHHQLTRVTARTALIGAVIALGSTAAAQGAMAGPTTSGIVTVPCNTKALTSALSGASNGEKLQLAFGCTYLLTAPLPAIDTSLTIVGLGATLDRSEAPRTPPFTILAVDGGDVTFVEVNFRNGIGRHNDCGVVGGDCADADVAVVLRPESVNLLNRRIQHRLNLAGPVFVRLLPLSSIFRQAVDGIQRAVVGQDI